MGAARNPEDSYTRHRYAPKLILTGRLSGTLNGRPVVIDADDSGIMLSTAMFPTAWNLRSYAGSFLPALQVLKRYGVPVRLKVAGIFSVEVLPRPNALVTMVVPIFARLV